MLVLLAALIMVPTLAFGEGKSEKAEQSNSSNKLSKQTFSEVSVHDPSIVKFGDTYYAFGSHIDAAKSKDLQNWTRFTNGYTTPNNVIYGDLSKNLAESFKWAGENDADNLGGFSVWAPDVLWNPDYVNADGTKGAYMMYYSVSSTYIRSAIGYAVSQNPEGPYTYVDTIMYSGFTDKEAYDTNSKINKLWSNTHIPSLIKKGEVAEKSQNWFNADGSYRNQVYPNAIDPAILRDKNGKLWMSYGSWSGGIFILEIDPATGKAIYPGKDSKTEDGRLVDRYFGTKISGGFGKSGEGPYMTYNKETGYYYLYVTYGWLGADGGYNMRVFRSQSPNGPFVDAEGKNAVLSSNTDPSAFGNKLIGNYLFTRDIGEAGTGIGVGYVSPGHNSVYYDDTTGQQFLVFHARFPEQGELHELRIHQMFMNKDGWPVVSPYRYTGQNLQTVREKDIVGDYKWINHGLETTGKITYSSFVSLKNDGTITGDVTGTWVKKGNCEAVLTIDGVTYNGVFVREWDPVSQQKVMTLTAMSNKGISVWGSKVETLTDKKLVKAVTQELTLGDTSRVVANLSLPIQGAQRTQISWKSSNQAVVENNGILHRPEAGQSSVTVTLTATIQKGKEKETKKFKVTVMPSEFAKLSAHYALDGNLSDLTGSFKEGTVTGNKIAQAGGNITYVDGKHGKAAQFDGKSGITLQEGLIDSDTYSVSIWVKPDKLTQYTPTFFGAKDDTHWLSLVPDGAVSHNTMIWAGSTSWYDGVTGMTIKAGEWSNLIFSVDKGTLKVYVNGVEKFVGSGFPNLFEDGKGIFALGINWWDAPFQGLMDDLRIYEGALTPAQIKELSRD